MDTNHATPHEIGVRYDSFSYSIAIISYNN